MYAAGFHPGPPDCAISSPRRWSISSTRRLTDSREPHVVGDATTLWRTLYQIVRDTLDRPSRDY